MIHGAMFWNFASRPNTTGTGAVAIDAPKPQSEEPRRGIWNTANFCPWLRAKPKAG